MNTSFKKSQLAVAIATAMSASGALAQTTLVSEFQVNMTPTQLSFPSVDSASDANGNFVVVWEEFDTNLGSGDEPEIRAQRYQPDGTPLGPLIQVNNVATGSQSAPSVAMNASGGFAVAWEDSNADGFYGGISARIFDNAGNPVGNQFPVPANGLDDEAEPQVAMDDGGNVVVAFSNRISPSTVGDIEARIFDNQGVAQGAEFPVSEDTVFNFSPAIGMGSGSAPQVVIAWAGQGTGDTDNGVFFRRIDAGGTMDVNSTLANTITPGDQIDPAIGVDTNNFVVAWESTEGGSGAPFDILARRFDTSGNAVDAIEFAVNSDTANTRTNENHPSAAMTGNGEFVIAFTSDVQDTGDVFRQRYTVTGSPVFAGPVQINQTTAGMQEDAEIDLSSNGELIAAWRGPDGAGGTQIYSLRATVPTSTSPGQLILEAEAKGSGTLALSPLGLLLGALATLGLLLRRTLVRLRIRKPPIDSG